MSTETTDNHDAKSPRGWILYDGSCGLCTSGVRRWRQMLERHGFGLAPLQADSVVARLGLAADELLREMRLITPDGRVCGGVEAFVEIARAVWWAWPFYLLAHVPGVRPLLRHVYRWIAHHRHALSKACALPPSPGIRTHAAREAWQPLFLADWLDVVFIHYEVDPSVLQPQVPFALDVRDGRAYVSLVAFTMRRLRPARLGRVAAPLLRPIATHSFLNVRTYVRHRSEPGIYFLLEWLPNRLAVLLGPCTFGLPYRLGRLVYRHDGRTGRLEGTVAACSNQGQLSYRGTSTGGDLEPCKPGSLDEFLLERYTAFTCRGRTRLLFRVRHAPWPQMTIDVKVDDDRLLHHSGAWAERAKLIGANYSPGVADVWIGRPRRTKMCTDGRHT